MASLLGRLRPRPDRRPVYTVDDSDDDDDFVPNKDLTIEHVEGTAERKAVSRPLTEVEKILDYNMRPMASNHPDLDNAVPKQVLVKHYLVKWKGLSYLHCSWVPEHEFQKAYKSIHHLQFMVNFFHYSMKSTGNNGDDFVAIHPEWTTVDRIIACRGEDDKKEYLVKYKELSYDECYWEYESDISTFQNEIQRFKDVNSGHRRDNYVDPERNHKDFKLFDHTPEFITGSLHPDQLEGLNFLRFSWSNRTHVVLTDEMGLGKTMQSIAFLASLFEENLAPYLVVAPLSTLRNWKIEFATWAPHMNVVMYVGTSQARNVIREHEFYFPNGHKSGISGESKQDRIKFDVILTSYEMIDIDRAFLKPIKWKCMIVDEGHRLKNRDSKLFISLKQFTSEHRVLLTGTPLQNNLEEIFVLMHFLDAGKFGSLEEFQEQFKDIDREEQISRLHKMLAPHLPRKVMKDVSKDMPPKAFKVANFEYINDNEAAALEEAQAIENKSSTDDYDYDRANYWEDVLKDKYEVQQAEELNALGKRKRNRKQMIEEDEFVLLEASDDEKDESADGEAAGSGNQMAKRPYRKRTREASYDDDDEEDESTDGETSRSENYMGKRPYREMTRETSSDGDEENESTDEDQEASFDDDEEDESTDGEAARSGNQMAKRPYRRMTLETSSDDDEEDESTDEEQEASSDDDEEDELTDEEEAIFINQMAKRRYWRKTREASSNDDEEDESTTDGEAARSENQMTKRPYRRTREASYDDEEDESTDEEQEASSDDEEEDKSTDDEVAIFRNQMAKFHNWRVTREVNTNGEAAQPEKKKAIKPYNLEGEGRYFKVLGFTLKQRKDFYYTLMRFGVGNYDWKEFLYPFKRKSYEVIKNYGTLFLKHIVEENEDINSQTFSDGVPKEGVQCDNVLARIALLMLVQEKVKLMNDNPRKPVFTNNIIARFPKLRKGYLGTDEHDKILLRAVSKNGFGKWLIVLNDNEFEIEKLICKAMNIPYISFNPANRSQRDPQRKFGDMLRRRFQTLGTAITYEFAAGYNRQGLLPNTEPTNTERALHKFASENISRSLSATGTDDDVEMKDSEEEAAEDVDVDVEDKVIEVIMLD